MFDSIDQNLKLSNRLVFKPKNKIIENKITKCSIYLTEKETELIQYLYDNKNNIIIVSHTIPIFEKLKNKDVYNSNEKSNGTNTKFINIINNNKKISHWIFGHTHNQFDKVINGVNFIAHPRGRPEDFNRRDYELKMIN